MIEHNLGARRSRIVLPYGISFDNKDDGGSYSSAGTRREEV